ncbi:hypothetical protein [Nocardia vinacea]|uniref:hypothetical protein n=1 Tax=Nocardia vinacea TaxID=96468 RepID=UPI001C3F2B47|nr:hypothetical protein [Nocardia vinacea]
MSHVVRYDNSRGISLCADQRCAPGPMGVGLAQWRRTQQIRALASVVRELGPPEQN